MVRPSTELLLLQSLNSHARKLKVEGSYDTVVKTCVVLHARKGLVNAIGALVVDVVLCIAMLIGHLRHAHRDSTGIWYLLYQQVMLRFFSCLGS